MFPRSAFPDGYFAPSYWPKTGGVAAPTGRGFKGAGRHYHELIAAMLRDQSRRGRLARQQHLSILEMKQKFLQEELDKAVQKRLAENATFTVVAAEI